MNLGAPQDLATALAAVFSKKGWFYESYGQNFKWKRSINNITTNVLFIFRREYEVYNCSIAYAYEKIPVFRPTKKIFSAQQDFYEQDYGYPFALRVGGFEGPFIIEGKHIVSIYNANLFGLDIMSRKKRSSLQGFASLFQNKFFGQIHYRIMSRLTDENYMKYYLFLNKDNFDFAFVYEKKFILAFSLAIYLKSNISTEVIYDNYRNKSNDSGAIDGLYKSMREAILKYLI